MRTAIVVVDDDDSVRALMTEELSEAGYKVEARENAHTALAALDLKVKHWNVVITDLHLPKMHGLEFVQMLRKRHPEVAIIAMSGYATQETEGQALAAGAAAFLRKPFSFGQLCQVLEQLECQQRVGNNPGGL